MTLRNDQLSFSDLVLYQGEMWKYHSSGTSPSKAFIYREKESMKDEEYKKLKGHLDYFTETTVSIYFDVSLSNLSLYKEIKMNKDARGLLEKEW